MNASRLCKTIAGCLAVIAPVGAIGATSAVAAASPPIVSRGVSIDLRLGWGSYRSCLVAAAGSVECFTSASALVARTDQLAVASSTCPVSLFRGASYTGQQLTIFPEGVWMNLSDFGFDNATVSFIGSGCAFHLAENQWGSGYWYPGYTGTWAATSNMGSSWNYRVSSVYIN